MQARTHAAALSSRRAARHRCWGPRIAGRPIGRAPCCMHPPFSSFDLPARQSFAPSLAPLADMDDSVLRYPCPRRQPARRGRRAHFVALMYGTHVRAPPHASVRVHCRPPCRRHARAPPPFLSESPAAGTPSIVLVPRRCVLCCRPPGACLTPRALEPLIPSTYLPTRRVAVSP